MANASGVLSGPGSPAAVAIGAALRLCQFALVRRSMWMDEAMMALNIPARSFASLLRPLDYNATAPFLFLWLERAWG